MKKIIAIRRLPKIAAPQKASFSVWIGYKHETKIQRILRLGINPAWKWQVPEEKPQFIMPTLQKIVFARDYLDVLMSSLDINEVKAASLIQVAIKEQLTPFLLRQVKHRQRVQSGWKSNFEQALQAYWVERARIYGLYFWHMDQIVSDIKGSLGAKERLRVIFKEVYPIPGKHFDHAPVIDIRDVLSRLQGEKQKLLQDLGSENKMLGMLIERFTYTKFFLEEQILFNEYATNYGVYTPEIVTSEFTNFERSCGQIKKIRR